MAKREKTSSIDKRIFDAKPAKLREMSTADLLQFGRQAQDWMNKRIADLGNYATSQTTSGQKYRPASDIDSRKSAIGAVKRARSMQSNPLSKRENIDALLEKAGETSMKGNKIILDPNTGRPKIVKRGEPGRLWESPAKQSQKQKQKIIHSFDDFKRWAEENTDWDSAEIVARYFTAKDKGVDPIEYWTDILKTKEQEQSTEDKFLNDLLDDDETVDDIFPQSPVSRVSRPSGTGFAKPGSIKIRRGSRSRQRGKR